MTVPTPHPHRRPPARRAFTLIELMVVVAIIGVLTSLLLIGVNVLKNGARRQQTRSTLELCRSLYSAWDAVAARPPTPGSTRFVPGVLPCPQNMTTDLNPPPTMATAQADDTMVGNRYGAAVWFTRDLMYNLRSVPVNAAALGKLSPGAVMTMPAAYNVTFPAPYSVAQWKITGSYFAFTPGQAFNQQFCRVYLTDPANVDTYVYYDCIQPSGPPFAPQQPPNVAYWLPSYPVTTKDGTLPVDDTVPVLLDGWGNPIIFVPGGILGANTDAASTDAYTLGSDGTVPPGSGGMASGKGASAVKTQVRSPDGRPFFASAGPDGDFSRSDDNLYSFEK